MICKLIFKKTSIYSLSQAVHTKSPLRKFWWTSVFIFSMCGCVYQLTTFLSHYFGYPVVVSLRVESKRNLDFPAVTVCNLNRMKNDYVKCIKYDLDFNTCLEEKKQGKGPAPPIIISERRSSASFSKQLSMKKDKNIRDVTTFLRKYMTLKYDDRKVSGHELKELIAYCFFGKKPCNEDDFTYFQSLQYGNCFKFNKKKNKSHSLKVPISDRKTELEMILYLNSSTYLEVTPSLGARITMHDPNEDPNPEEGGINISPGFQTLVQIKQKCHRRLQDPYIDKCINYKNNPDIPGENQKQCVRICIQEQNLANCSCVDPTISALKDKKPCDIRNYTDASCLDRVIDYLIVNDLPCNCPPPCFIMGYEKKLSFSKWPSPWFKCSFCGERSSVSSTMANVKVLYSTFERVTYDQISLFQSSEFYGNFGSLINLWFGLSLLIIFEISEILIYIFYYYYKGINDK